MQRELPRRRLQQVTGQPARDVHALALHVGAGVAPQAQGLGVAAELDADLLEDRLGIGLDDLHRLAAQQLHGRELAADIGVLDGLSAGTRQAGRHGRGAVLLSSGSPHPPVACCRRHSRRHPRRRAGCPTMPQDARSLQCLLNDRSITSARAHPERPRRRRRGIAPQCGVRRVNGAECTLHLAPGDRAKVGYLVCFDEPTREAIMHKSLYPVPQDFADPARIKRPDYGRMYAESIRSPQEFWANIGRRIDWIKPFTQVKDVSFAARTSVSAGFTTAPSMSRRTVWTVTSRSAATRPPSSGNRTIRSVPSA